MYTKYSQSRNYSEYPLLGNGFPIGSSISDSTLSGLPKLTNSISPHFQNLLGNGISYGTGISNTSAFGISPAAYGISPGMGISPSASSIYEHIPPLSGINKDKIGYFGYGIPKVYFGSSIKPILGHNYFFGQSIDHNLHSLHGDGFFKNLLEIAKKLFRNIGPISKSVANVIDTGSKTYNAGKDSYNVIKDIIKPKKDIIEEIKEEKKEEQKANGIRRKYTKKGGLVRDLSILKDIVT